KYFGEIKTAARELFALFFYRIYRELPSVTLAEFSTLKILQASNFREFRKAFKARLGRNFLVPASTFDNVKGKFPIGFFIWHLGIPEQFAGTKTTLYVYDGEAIGEKDIVCYDNEKLVIEWLRQFYDKTSHPIGYLCMVGTDMQHNNCIFIANRLSPNDIKKKLYTTITEKNIVPMCIYWAIRHVVDETWYNDRDQFLYPNDGWQNDYEFQTDCLVYALFGNNISLAHGTNHWIPFTEQEVGAKDNFTSHFLSDYLNNTHTVTQQAMQTDLFSGQPEQGQAGVYRHLDYLSHEAETALAEARNLWNYYHQQPGANPNASYYDIRLHFQGIKTTKSGKEQMNTDSMDAQYTTLNNNLRQAMRQLAAHIEPKVYQYGFLK
ncbi:MAG: hypothetical protein K6A67_09085, partial [Bacteroidales bacterium]|nr:hypothetical protein [Bacteroidales bacterium]